MVRWMEMIADRLEPIYNILSNQVLGGDYIQMDETRSAIWIPGREKPRSATCGSPENRGATRLSMESQSCRSVREGHPACGLQGVLQTDAYAAYGSFAKDRPQVTMAGLHGPCPAQVFTKPASRSREWPTSSSVTSRLSTASKPSCENESQPRVAGSGPRRSFPSNPGATGRALKILASRFLPQSNMVRPLLTRFPSGPRLRLPHRRACRNRQQSGGKCDSPLCRRQKELALYRGRRSWKENRHPLYHRGELPPPGHRSPGLSPRRAHFASRDIPTTRSTNSPQRTGKRSCRLPETLRRGCVSIGSVRTLRSDGYAKIPPVYRPVL